MNLDKNIVLQAENVCKVFTPNVTGRPVARGISKIATENIVALEDISFELRKGEILGIIGANGAGKSTLLKIISGIVKPSSGRLFINGEIASILEVGTGFHPDLSGYDNILLNGSLNGKSKKEVKQSIPEIIAFSGLAGFIDMPVKYYSSGMFMRLAFATATHMNADIVLLDEVFSVGDMEFKAKCLDKIRELITKGKTIIVVSHDLGIVKSICTRCIILDHGRLHKAGAVQDVMQEYIEEAITNDGKGSSTKENSFNGPPMGNEYIKLCEMHVSTTMGSSVIQMTDAVKISYTYRKSITMFGRVSLNIKSEQQFPVMALSPYRSTESTGVVDDNESGTYTATAVIPAGLFNKGLFILDFILIDEDEKVLLHLADVCYFKVHLSLSESDTSLYSGAFPGPLMPVLPWQLHKIS